MSQLQQICKQLKLSYQTVAGVPASFEKIRGEAIAYLSQQGLIAEDVTDSLTSVSKADVIKQEIALVRQKLGKAQNLKVQFQLTEKLAGYHEQLFAIEVEREEQYRTVLENIAKTPSEQAETANDSVLEGLLAESEVLQIKLRTLQEQAKGLQQAIDNQTSDERQQLVQELAAVQKQEMQVNRELLYNRQAQTLNKLGAPKRIKKKQLSSQLSQLEAKKFVNDLMLHSLDRSVLLEKILLNLRNAISAAGIAQAQIKLDNMPGAELRRRTHRIDWL